jgi:hypothetical protein
MRREGILHGVLQTKCRTFKEYNGGLGLSIAILKGVSQNAIRTVTAHRVARAER